MRECAKVKKQVSRDAVVAFSGTRHGVNLACQVLAAVR